jgi:hypothetical protein
MKRLILVLALLFVPLLASAQQSETLLLPDATLYTIHYERAYDHPEVKVASSTYLVLTTRRGESVVPEIVPATMFGGVHFNPAIAYDSESGTLFAFWIHNPTGRATQLMFASRSADGVWSEAASFGAFEDRRENLRIAVTRKFVDENGEVRTGVTVHLAWWQFDPETHEKSAQYMMVTIQNGNVVNLEPLDLSQFLPQDLAPAEQGQEIDGAVLMQPLLVSSPQQDSVALVFGHLESGTLTSVRIRPGTKIGANGRLRVPGGRREGGPYQAPAMSLSASNVDGIYGNDGTMAFYTKVAGKLRYVLLKEGVWSQAHSITLSEQITEGTAVDALRRLVTDN